MAEKYVRLVDGYRYRANENETTGEEVYVRWDDHAAAVDLSALPAVGTTQLLNPSGSAIASCLCRSVEASYKDQDINTPIYKFTFATQQGSVNAINTDPAARKYSGGGEVVCVNGREWYWASDKKPINKDTIYKRIAQGTIGRSKGPMTTGGKDSWITTAIGLLGKVNNGAFCGFPKGCVLFDSFTGGSSYKDGVIRWTFECSFTWRIINDATTAISADTWQYVWRTDKPGWDKPTDTVGAGGNLLYVEGDLESLFT